MVSFGEELKTYVLPRMRVTNQRTCISLKPSVAKGKSVQQGQILCEGHSTHGGELVLGCNLPVAFMPWQIHNYEDAIVMSECVVREYYYNNNNNIYVIII